MSKLPVSEPVCSTAERAPPRHPAFTLVELLVVIAIIGVLVALLLPAVQAAREAARRTKCVNNIKQIGIALHAYHSAFGRLPYGSPTCCRGPKTNGGVWTTMILPLLEEGALYDAFDWNKHLKDPQHNQLVQTVIPTYICPSDHLAASPVFADRFGRDNPNPALGLWYSGCMGPTMPDACSLCPMKLQKPAPGNWCCQGWNLGTQAGGGYPVGNSVGMFGRHRQPEVTFASVTDGLSQTLMVGETLPGDCIFMSAFAVNFNVSSTAIPINRSNSDAGKPASWDLTSGFKSPHPGGINAIYGDASVHFLSDSIDHRIYSHLGTRAGNELYYPE